MNGQEPEVCREPARPVSCCFSFPAPFAASYSINSCPLFTVGRRVSTRACTSVSCVRKSEFELTTRFTSCEALCTEACLSPWAPLFMTLFQLKQPSARPSTRTGEAWKRRLTAKSPRRLRCCSCSTRAQLHPAPQVLVLHQVRLAIPPPSPLCTFSFSSSPLLRRSDVISLQVKTFQRPRCLGNSLLSSNRPATMEPNTLDATPYAPLSATSNTKTTALELSLSPTHPVEHAEFTVSRPGQLTRRVIRN